MVLAKRQERVVVAGWGTDVAVLSRGRSHGKAELAFFLQMGIIARLFLPDKPAGIKTRRIDAKRRTGSRPARDPSPHEVVSPNPVSQESDYSLGITAHYSVRS